MRIFCKLKRPGGTEIRLGDTDYHFKPEPTEGQPESKWPHVCDVENQTHAIHLLENVSSSFMRDPHEVEAEDEIKQAAKRELANLRSFKNVIVDLAQRSVNAIAPLALLVELRSYCGIQEPEHEPGVSAEAGGEHAADEPGRAADLDPEIPADEGGEDGDEGGAGAGEQSSANDPADTSGPMERADFITEVLAEDAPADAKKAIIDTILAKIADGRLTKHEATDLYTELTGEAPKPMWTKAGIVEAMQAWIAEAKKT